MRKRAVVAGILALSLSGFASTLPARAQANWPNGQVLKIVVPFAPGGTYDIVARLLVQPLGQALKTSVIIETGTGAGTNLGTEMGVRAPADGLTLLMGGIPNAINESLYPKLNFNVRRDLAGVRLVPRLPNAMVVNSDV